MSATLFPGGRYRNHRSRSAGCTTTLRSSASSSRNHGLRRKSNEKPQPVLTDGLRKPTVVELMKVTTIPLSGTNIAISLQNPTRDSMAIYRISAAVAGTAEAAPPRISGRGGVSAIPFTVLHPKRIAQLIECLATSMSITYIVQPCTYALHHRNVVKTHFTAYLLVADSQVSAEYPSGVLCKHHIHLAGPDVLRRNPVNLTGFQPYSFYCLVHNFNPPYSSSNIVFPAHSGHFTMCLRNC